MTITFDHSNPTTPTAPLTLMADLFVGSYVWVPVSFGNGAEITTKCVKCLVIDRSYILADRPDVLVVYDENYGIYRINFVPDRCGDIDGSGSWRCRKESHHHGCLSGPADRVYDRRPQGGGIKFG